MQHMRHLSESRSDSESETKEMSDHEIFMGDLPLMTETGTFVINGAERVIVSQLVRSPGIYYELHMIRLVRSCMHVQ